MTRLFLEILNTCTQIFVKLQQHSYQIYSVANLVEEIFCLVVLWTFVAIGLSFSGLVIFFNFRDNLTTTMTTIKTSGDQENPHCRSGRVLAEV